MPPSSQSARVTMRLRWAPETAPSATMMATSATAVALAFSSNSSPHVLGAQPLRRDAGADDGDEQPGGSQELGQRPTG